MKQTLYDFLGVAPDASFEDIEVAYAKRFEVLRTETSWDSNRLVMLSEAREVLTDPDRRAAYDASLAAPAQTTERNQPDDIEDERQSTGKWFIAVVLLVLIVIWWAMRDDAPPVETTTAPGAPVMSETTETTAQSPSQLIADEPTFAEELTVVEEPITGTQAEAVIADTTAAADAANGAPANPADAVPARAAPASIVGEWDCFDPVTGRSSQYAFADDGTLTTQRAGGGVQIFTYELAGRQIKLVDTDPPGTIGVDELSAHKLILNTAGEGRRLVCSR